MALALTMLLARGAVTAKITSVKSTIGNTITVSPAGAQGFEGSGTLLTDANVTDAKSVTHVVSATPVLTARISNSTSTSTSPDGSTTGTTSLESAITRPANDSNRGGQTGGMAMPAGNFTPPTRITGTTDPTNKQILSVNEFIITDGKAFDGSSNENIALIGKSLAEKNNLKVGSTFTAYDKTITVVGIYDTGNTFTNAGVVMPLAALQSISGQTGVNSISVQVDSVENLTSTTTALQSKLGSSADVVSQQDRASEAVAPLESIKTITMYSLIGAVASGAIIIFLTMLMIVRERRREIGVFKAIGASTNKIVTQFVSESLVLTGISAIVGTIFGVLFSSSVVNLLVTTASSSSSSGGPGMGGPGGGFRGAAQFGRGALQGIQANVGWNVLLFGLLGAVIIALVGSAIPSYLISKVRPAEVMRGE
jgi:putative ABC transport system permease protein